MATSKDAAKIAATDVYVTLRLPDSMPLGAGLKLAFVSSSDPDAPLREVEPQYRPDTVGEAVEMLHEFNAWAAGEDDVIDLLGIFPTRKGRRKTRGTVAIRIPASMPPTLGFRLAFYNPADPAAPLRPFYADLMPATIGDAMEVASEYNRIAAGKPELHLHEVLGIFPQVARADYFLGLYDPLDEAALPAPIDQSVAATLDECLTFVADFNEFAAANPRLVRLCGIFRRADYPALTAFIR